MARNVRVVESHRYYLITNRCILGMFLMRPDDECRRILKGCLARAVDKYGVELVCFVFMSNHFHLIARFPELNMAEFMEELQSQIARRINNHRGRKGKFFGQRYDDQALLDHQVLRDKICYVLNNPLNDRAVRTAADWPGVTSMTCHRDGAPLEGKWLNAKTWTNLKRREGDYRREDAMETYSVDLHLPEALEGETDEERRENLLELVENDREDTWEKATGDRNRPPRVSGKRAVLSKSWQYRSDEPGKKYERSRLGVAVDTDVMGDYEDERQQTTRDYRRASGAWRRSKAEPFPAGTYPPGWRRCVGFKSTA